MGPVDFIHICCHLSTSSLRKFSLILTGQGGPQSWTKLVETNENYQPFPLVLILLSALMKGTVPLETMEPFARGKTLSLPNVVAANSPRWDENRDRGKDESNRKPR